MFNAAVGPEKRNAVGSAVKTRRRSNGSFTSFVVILFRCRLFCSSSLSLSLSLLSPAYFFSRSSTFTRFSGPFLGFPPPPRRGCLFFVFFLQFLFIFLFIHEKNLGPNTRS